jgi:hypothetical protein
MYGTDDVAGSVFLSAYYCVRFQSNWPVLREGAVKSLARPSSQYRRTESIVSLERGVGSVRVPNSKSFLVTEGERSMSGEARDFSNMETRAVIRFPSPTSTLPQGKAPKKIHAILTETLAFLLPGRGKDLSAPLCIHIPKFSLKMAPKAATCRWKL